MKMEIRKRGATVKIETKRLVLRNFNSSDFEDFWEYASQPNVYPCSGWPAFTQKEKAMEQFKREMARPLQFAIELKEAHKVVGSIALKPTREGLLEKLDCKAEETKEIGYLLNEKFWGRGIMTEAVKAIVKFGFEKLGLKVITAGCFEQNVGSKRVQEKCGFTPFQRTKNAGVWHETGEPADAIECKLTKEDYEKIEQYKILKIKVTKDVIHKAK